MQYSIVPYSGIDLSNRMDAEYYQPTYLYVEEALLKRCAVPLRNYCQITGSAFYPAATHLYADGEVPFIRCVDCIAYPVITKRQDVSFEKIPQIFADNHKNIKRLNKGDIVVTKVGSPCYASIIHDIEDVALSRTVLGIKSIKGIDPYYLTAYLRSKYGFLQLYRERELTIQFQLTLERVGNILIYKPSDPNLEMLISKLLMSYEKCINQSEALNKKAQGIILEDLGLVEWEPKRSLVFIKRYAETRQYNRIDAEYYQPRYEELVNSIKNYYGGWDTIGNLVTVKKCIEVGSSEYTEEGVPFIRVSNVSPFEITREKFISEQLYQVIKHHQPEQGEILFSKDATPGIAYYINETPPKMIPSSGILRLKRKTDKVNDEYLTLVLNSVLIQEQVKRDVGGSVILHWRPDQVKDAVIPILPIEKQRDVKNKVIESFSLRKQSKHLLECAKKAVEIAIEEDENVAITWLNKQLGARDANKF